jgi:hypothetical protein
VVPPNLQPMAEMVDLDLSSNNRLYDELEMEHNNCDLNVRIRNLWEPLVHLQAAVIKQKIPILQFGHIVAYGIALASENMEMQTDKHGLLSSMADRILSDGVLLENPILDKLARNLTKECGACFSTLMQECKTHLADWIQKASNLTRESLQDWIIPDSWKEPSLITNKLSCLWSEATRRLEDIPSKIQAGELTTFAIVVISFLLLLPWVMNPEYQKVMAQSARQRRETEQMHSEEKFMRTTDAARCRQLDVLNVILSRREKELQMANWLTLFNLLKCYYLNS